jgi:8-oxo-dGTP pyrophosphatase MutT (NUDIX family)
LDHQTDPTVLLTVRSAELTHHAGQVSFPGGGIEAGETPTMAACREAEEEVGLATAAVHVIGELPPSRIDVSRFAVRAVVGWWDGQAHLTANPAEVAAIAHLPVSHLADPDHRFTWLHPRGATGPGFEADDLFIWGFTAFVLDALLTAGSWSQDWDPSDIRPVPPRWRPV